MQPKEIPQAVKILAISSGGGHWVELRRIMPAFSDLDVSYASVHKDGSNDVSGGKYYTFTNFTRFNIFSSIACASDVAKIILEVKPNIVLSTGAAPALLAFIFSKIIFRSKTIWIDSIANSEQMSTSGKFARFISDEWLTQWPHLASGKGPHHWGSVL